MRGTLGPWMLAAFKLVPEAASIPEATVESMTFTHYSVQMSFVLISDVEEPPPTAARPVEGTSTLEKSLLASSNTHRDALIRALSQIRVETTTTPEELIHMMTAGRAICIVFFDDDLPPEGSDHTRPLYISVGCSGSRVPSVLLDNGSTLNIVRAYDSTRREVMGTLEIELLIGPATFVTVFQILRIPASFNLLLGRPWIHRAGVIPSSLHQKISHNDKDLLLTGFTFEEVQALEMKDFCLDFVAMFVPTKAYYRYMARLCKKRVRARLTHTPFDYPIRLYTMSLADYFMRASEPQTHSEEIIGGLNTT
ncbi:hypothetical protein CK203_057877 [Vitis vinifera]|uniref:Uncharacterized protein n=1 Tax=Vitis vinifera TaxID=29760 RepID=A0A438GSA3_VITVI|nr:hypothetical protein CK203_057877 [Vitis vinifera]